MSKPTHDPRAALAHLDRPYYEISGADLRAWRKAAGISQVNLADHLHIERRTVQRYEAKEFPAVMYCRAVRDYAYEVALQQHQAAAMESGGPMIVCDLRTPVTVTETD